jgi:hypothetical protein
MTVNTSQSRSSKTSIEVGRVVDGLFSAPDGSGLLAVWRCLLKLTSSSYPKKEEEDLIGPDCKLNDVQVLEAASQALD